MLNTLPKAPHPAPQAEDVIEAARLDFTEKRDDMRRNYTEREAFHLAVGGLLADTPTDTLMLRIELSQMIKAATTLAQHILAQPATGEEVLSDVWQVANQVMAARGPRAEL